MVRAVVFDRSHCPWRRQDDTVGPTWRAEERHCKCSSDDSFRVVPLRDDVAVSRSDRDQQLDSRSRTDDGSMNLGRIKVEK